jgi:tRNA threonylcarbamoyladenosine biosynthesis protein TsaE
MTKRLISRNIYSDSADQTISIGKQIGSNLLGGEVIELISDVGGGKTTITKGIALGSGSKDLVSSPSFTLCNEYQATKFKIYHYDFYRLAQPGIIKQELQEVLADKQDVVLVEWPDTIEDVLPPSKIVIKITASTETRRDIAVSCDQEHSYILEGIL